MTTAALPASASATALDGEGQLVRSAARGDADAFGELFQRHSEPAWRLAQAVAPDRPAAAAAFRDGFVEALGSPRSLRRTPGVVAFRPGLLAAVYKAAVDQSYDRSAPPPAARRSKGDANVALADAAFRSLPERWRAAVWLSEVESMDAERIAPILGVSVAVATQLVARGRKGLAGRFAQARREVPDHLGGVLRTAAVATPTNLLGITESRWAEAGRERGPVIAPVAAWLEDRAVRPMSVAVGALVGLGLIGLGVVPQGSPVRSQLGATGNGSLSGAVPVQTCLGLPCSTAGASTAQRMALSSTGGTSASSLLGGSGALGSGATQGGGIQGGGIQGGGATAPAGATAGTTTSGSGSTPASNPVSTPTAPTAPPSTPTSGGQNPTTPQAPSPGTGGPAQNPPGGNGGTTTPPATQTIVPLAPIATVTKTGSALNVNLLPSSTSGSSAATVTVGGCSGLGVSVGSTQVLGSCPSSSTSTAAPAPTAGTATPAPSTASNPTPTAPTTATNPVGSAVSGVTSTVGGVVGGVTNTLGSLTSGL